MRRTDASPMTAWARFRPRLRDNRKLSEHENRSAKQIMTKPCQKPNKLPAKNENTVPGIAGMTTLINLRPNNPNGPQNPSC